MNDNETQNQDVPHIEMKTLYPTRLLSAAMNDPELGGGSFEQWKHTMHHCNIATLHFDAEATCKALAEVHYHLHPEVIRFFHRVGKLLCPTCSGGGPEAQA